MLSNKPGKKLNIYVPDYVVFDLETTGIHPTFDKVVEISAIKVTGGAIEAEFSTLVNPEMKIPYFATSVHHITNEMVKDAPTFEAALGDFLDFAGDYVLVGHNIRLFDLKFLAYSASHLLHCSPSASLTHSLFRSNCIPQDWLKSVKAI